MAYPNVNETLRRMTRAKPKAAPRPRPTFLRGRAPMPIVATAAPRSKRGLGSGTIVRTLGDLENVGDYYGSGELGNWFTDILNVGPKINVPGVTGAPIPEHYNAWRAAVLKRSSYGVQNQVARFPSGPSAGKWAEKYWDAGQVGKAADPANGGVWRYANAPQTVWDEDDAIKAFNDRAAEVAAVPGNILTGAAAIPRKVIGSALGIPQWLMPVLLLGGAAIVVRQYLPKR